MTNKKIASEFAVGIILLLAIGFGGIFWMQEKKMQISKNTIETRNAFNLEEKQAEQLKLLIAVQCEEYRNEELGFQFTCPKGWEYVELNENEKGIDLYAPGQVQSINDFIAGKREDEGPISNIRILYYESLADNFNAANGGYKTLDAFMKDEIFGNMKKTTLGGVDAYRGVEYGFMNYDVVYAEHNNHIYAIVSDQFTSQEANKIMDTFKFISQGNAKLSSQELVKNIIEKHSLKDLQKYDAPDIFWKNESKNVICLNNVASETHTTIRGKTVVENLVNKIIDDLKQQGFTLSFLNTAGSNEGSESKRIGLEKESLKCTIVKSANEQRNDTTKNKYFFSFGCANLTEIDISNFNEFNPLVNKGSGKSVVCVNKNNGSFMAGGVAGFEDDIGAVGGATVYGKNINGKWEIFIGQDLPPCSFMDGFPKDIYEIGFPKDTYGRYCLDKNDKERKIL